MKDLMAAMPEMLDFPAEEFRLTVMVSKEGVRVSRTSSTGNSKAKQTWNFPEADGQADTEAIADIKDKAQAQPQTQAQPTGKVVAGVGAGTGTAGK